MTRTTLQRAKDTQDLGITIELLPLSCPNEMFDLSKFYVDLLGLEGDDLVNFMASAGNNQDIIFSTKELSEIKRVATGHLHLLGFKPLSCLRDYYNLKPSTFLYPSDEGTDVSMCTFIALHRSMVQLSRFAVAFIGSSSRPQLVALIAQDEVIQSGVQIEPPGMHMIYLPYSDDIRPIEERYSDTSGAVTKASDDQIKRAADLIKRVDLKDFSVFQFTNPGKLLLPPAQPLLT
ncbi:hypothetical protein TSUD_00180 [Trifolium subterraneum]|nr:hypothetical protein TSUD_00180 [Trifolium subterraneum]